MSEDNAWLVLNTASRILYEATGWDRVSEGSAVLRSRAKTNCAVK